MTKTARNFIVLLVVGGACVFVAGVLTARSKSPGPAPGHDPRKTLDGRTVSEKGTLEYPNSVGHPGDPEEAVKDFKRIYSAMDDYRKRNDKCPDCLEDLMKAGQLADEDLQNPDWNYAEQPDALAGKTEPACVYAQNFMANRPDGTPKPAFPKKGELDVWVFSDLTARRGTVLYPDGSRDMHYSGVFVVLFSDGSIRKFKHKEVFMVDEVNFPGARSIAFPGMTGYKGERLPFAEDRSNKPWKKLRVTYEE